MLTALELSRKRERRQLKRRHKRRAISRKNVGRTSEDWLRVEQVTPRAIKPAPPHPVVDIFLRAAESFGLGNRRGR